MNWHILLSMANYVSSYLVILMAIIFFTLLWKAVISMSTASHIPSPRGNYWLFGHLFEMRKSRDILQTFAEWAKIYGPVVEFRPLGVFDQTYFLISDADALKQILVSKSFNYVRPLNNKFESGVFPTKNIFMATGKDHSRMRKMINPAFTVNSLRSMLDTVKEKANLLAKHWNDTISTAAKNSASIECCLPVQNDITRVTLDTLGKCVFGYEFNTTEKGDTTISNAFNDMLIGGQPGTKRFVRELFFRLPFLKYFMSSLRRKREAFQLVSRHVKQIIDDKRTKRQKATNPGRDLLDRLLEAVDDETGNSMDKEELFGQTFVFLLAGHKTSSVALSWILYHLAMFPYAQEKLRREIRETINGKEAGWENYESMKYLTAVINESMRLRPPAAVWRREVIQDDNILGYNIPAKSMIIIPPYVLHRKPEYWSDPEIFSPERFLESNDVERQHRYTFLPFSSGPRQCIGYRFALMEIKIILSTLINKFSFSMVPGMSFEGSLAMTYKPKPNLDLLVRRMSE